MYEKQQTIEWDAERNTAFTCLKHFSRLVEMARPRFDKAPHQQISNTSIAQGTGKWLILKLCQFPNIMKWKLRLHLIIVHNVGYIHV